MTETQPEKKGFSGLAQRASQWLPFGKRYERVSSARAPSDTSTARRSLDPREARQQELIAEIRKLRESGTSFSDTGRGIALEAELEALRAEVAAETRLAAESEFAAVQAKLDEGRARMEALQAKLDAGMAALAPTAGELMLLKRSLGALSNRLEILTQRHHLGHNVKSPVAGCRAHGNQLVEAAVRYQNRHVDPSFYQ